MALTEEKLEEIRAMCYLETEGSTSYPPTRWEFKDDDGNEHAYAYSEDNYAPEWLSERDLGCDRDQCVSVVDFGYGEAAVPAGYRIAYQYEIGEPECPWCGDGTGDYEMADGEISTQESRRATCELCERGGRLYETGSIVVFAPRYAAGSGQHGCLYDSEPAHFTSREDAVEYLVECFDGYFQELAEAEESDDCPNTAVKAETEEQEMRQALLKHGSFQFSLPSLAGAAYCEIADLAAILSKLARRRRGVL
jgi:hypothetical protein